MKKSIICTVLIGMATAVSAQSTFTLQRCRDMALENNRQLKISKLTTSIAEDVHKVAKTKYLPRLTALAGYEHLSREISLLSDEQKNTLSNLGTNSVGKISGEIGKNIAQWAQQGLISPQTAQDLGKALGNITTPLAQAGNNIGEALRQDLRTNSKNIYAGGVMLMQPIYMGGAIKAANDMAAIGEEMARNDIALKQQTVLYAVDNAYWLIVSLKKKERLAMQYCDLAKHLSGDVSKMYREGVATKADRLKVEVAVNTVELQIAELQNGIALAKMALCELCGLDLNTNPRLADEDSDELSAVETVNYNAADTTYNARPEVRLLQNSVELQRQNTKLIRSLFLPHVVLTAGYNLSNPNSFNGFEQKFADMWNVGIIVHVPLWNWGEGKYKVRAAKTATTLAEMELSDVRNKIRLETEQNRFRLDNANERLATAHKNMASANENLRTADIGFREGVMTVTDVMAAQTAWLAARTAVLDAEIAVRTAQVGLRKALGKIY